ncbi:MAG: phosphate transporter, periplasmic phosphate-binding protein [Hyphomicrobiales bacterium]|nr:phosphate transporter, periplasmic phosphate-binding protein [Hyphomicrobiales bacterium]
MDLAKILRTAVMAAAAVSVTVSAQAADITGAGATFPYPIYSKWADAYKTATGMGLNYQSIGSGAGIKQIQAKTVTFGATDAPLKGEALAKDGLVQFPMVMGAIVMVVNIDGVKPGELVLDGKTVGDIYLGAIKKWDDAAIKKLNPSLTLPSTAITVVRRSDGSGTSFNFTDYLAKVNADWKSKVGVGQAVEWPVGVGAKGNEGIAGNVAQTKGGIGYVEYAYAKQNNMTFAALVNASGKTVKPTLAAFQAAASNADWTKEPGFYQILTNQPGDASWPITAATFILMYKQPTDKTAAADALKFFTWAYDNGDKMAEDLDYIPMPENVVKLVKDTWAKDIQSK